MRLRWVVNGLIKSRPRRRSTQAQAALRAAKVPRKLL